MLPCCTENTPITMSQLMHSSAENGSPNLLDREGTVPRSVYRPDCAKLRESRVGHGALLMARPQPACMLNGEPIIICAYTGICRLHGSTQMPVLHRVHKAAAQKAYSRRPARKLLAQPQQHGIAGGNNVAVQRSSLCARACSHATTVSCALLGRCASETPSG